MFFWWQPCKLLPQHWYLFDSLSWASCNVGRKLQLSIQICASKLTTSSFILPYKQCSVKAAFLRHWRGIFYSDTKWNDHGVILMQKKKLKKKESYPVHKSKLKNYVSLLDWNQRNYCWHFVLHAYKYFLFQAFHAVPRETGAYISSFCIVRSLLCQSIHASFVDFVVFVWSHYETTKKAIKYIFYAKENGSWRKSKRWAGYRWWSWRSQFDVKSTSRTSRANALKLIK